MSQLRSDIDDASVVVSPMYQRDLVAAHGGLAASDSARQPFFRLRASSDQLDGTIHLPTGIGTLLQAYVEPRRVSDPGRGLLPDERRSVAALVLDGILEIESDGEFVRGLHAVGRLFDGPASSLLQNVAEPTRSALDYAGALLPIPASQLASRLYRYGTSPVSPRWLARVPDASAVAEYLRVDELSRRALIADWARVLSASTEWLIFRRRGTLDHRANIGRVHKMYLGIASEELGAALAAVADDLFSSDAIAFKVAATPHGLRRADKCVAYFETRQALECASERLGRRLATERPHPVPFAESCPYSKHLWWGSDSAVREQDDDAVGTSGRYEVCSLVSHSLAIASTARNVTMPAIDFALLRLTLDGWELESFANADWRVS